MNKDNNNDKEKDKQSQKNKPEGDVHEQSPQKEKAPAKITDFSKAAGLKKRKNAEQEDYPQDNLEDLVKDIVSKMIGGIRNEPSADTLAEELSKRAAFPQMKVDRESNRKARELKVITDTIDKRLVPNTALENDRGWKVDYEKQLNPQQLTAVITTDMPLLVIAGAGSGKTRVISYKVSYLIEKGMNPSEILLLTFTKKAANEMITRVEQLLGDKSISNVMGGTFHSFANYILRRFGKYLGLSSSFSIIDVEDAADIIDLIKSELEIKKGEKRRPFPRKSKIQAIISKSKNIERSPEAIIDKYYPEDLEFVKEIKDIAHAVELFKKSSNLLDYDDLLLLVRDNLRDNAHFRQKLQNLFSYILVDEFQDTNNAQRQIVEYVAGEKGNITVVGDDSQSIYGFRGANYENILRFPQSFPNCKAVKLEENYRSDRGVLDFINDVIYNARIGFKKRLYSLRDTGQKPVLKKLADAPAEAEFIVDKILEMRGSELEFGDFAVLSRASWQSNFVQTELLKRKIPFIVVGGIKFSERRHVKDMVSFIKILRNTLDAVAWHRILRLIEGIGKVRAKEVVEVIHCNNGVIDFSKFSTRKYYGELTKLQDMFNRVIRMNLSFPDTVDVLLHYYKPVLRQIEDNFQVRFQDLDIFAMIAKNYSSADKFLEEFTLEPPSTRYQDAVTPLYKETEEKPLVVSTIHSAKGLEWYTVFIPFALDGLIPSVRSLNNLEELEEERRLFYVAASRAKEKLFVTMPAYVSSWDAVFTKPSRFLYEIDKRHYEA